MLATLFNTLILLSLYIMNIDFVIIIIACPTIVLATYFFTNIINYITNIILKTHSHILPIIQNSIKQMITIAIFVCISISVYTIIIQGIDLQLLAIAIILIVSIIALHLYIKDNEKYRNIH